MSEKEILKNISSIILSSFSANLTSGGSKLNKLEQIYQQKCLGFKQQISQSGRMLTKKIFGTAIRCIRKSGQQQLFANSNNLVSLSFIFLHIIFLDEYVLRLVIEQLNSNQQTIAKMVETHNPYQDLGINEVQLHKILVQIILKINSLKAIFSTSDILKDYYVASQTFSYFLRMILVKLKYANADNLQVKLSNTSEIYSILCQYFDLNVIARNSNHIRKNNVSPMQTNFGEKSQVYLFNDYNLFISTVDNQQFCTGRYYSNQNQLFSSQKQIRKSTLQFILKCKQAQEIQQQQQSQQKGDKVQLRLSQFQLDLGASNSTMMIGQKDAETPYFSSNAPTPQFGSLLQSTRFRKSIDLEAHQELSSIKNPQSSPMSQQIRQTQFYYDMKNKQLKQVANVQQKQQKSGFYQNQALLNPKFVPYNFQNRFKNKLIQPTEQDSDFHNKPRSPPSTQSKFKKQKEQQRINYIKNQNQKSPFQKMINLQNSKISKFSQDKLQQRAITKKQGNEINNKNAKQIQYLKNQFNMPLIDKKSFQFQNQRFRQMMRLSSKSKQEKPLQNMNEFNKRWEQNYVNVQHHIQQKYKQNKSKKKQLSSRKYSINEGKSQQKNSLGMRQKNAVHYSNHFKKGQEQYQQMIKSRKTVLDMPKKQFNSKWENQNALSADGERQISNKSPRKMQFTSNIMSFQIKSSPKQQQYKKQFEYKKFSPYKYQSHFQKNKTKMKIPNLKFDKQKIIALRNSRSSKSSRSPRLVNNLEWYQKMGLSKHVSEYTPNTPSTPKGANDRSFVINQLNVQNIGIPNSKMKKKYSQEEIKQKYIRGFNKLTKVSKFPQFLRHAKSRKTNKNENAMQKNKGIMHENKILKINNKNQVVTSQGSRRNKNKNINFDTQLNVRQKKNSIYQYSKAYTEGPQQSYSQSLNKLKHNLSQPRFIIVPPILSNDFNHRPWVGGQQLQHIQISQRIIQQPEKQIFQKRQTFATSSPMKDNEYINRPTFSSQYVNIQQINKSYNLNTISEPMIRYANIPHQVLFPQRFSTYQTQNDMKRSWRTCNQIQTLKQSSYTRLQQSKVRDANLTTLNSTVLSKAESPQAQFCFQHQIMFTNQNIRRQIWEPHIITKL